tara:strand:- start:21093 stop:21404 length:312 start_codon:yes stop_codon:yes gene_type:complete
MSSTPSLIDMMSDTDRALEALERVAKKTDALIKQLPVTYDDLTFVPNTGQVLWWRDEGGLSSSTSCELINGAWICPDADRPVSECFSRRELVPGEHQQQGTQS